MVQTHDKDNNFICTDCFRLKRCKEPVISWIFFIVALISVVSIRAVNFVMDSNPVLSKIFWYIGVGGFFVFFIYKFKNDLILRREIENAGLIDKLLNKENISEHDYEILGTIMCRMKPKKDMINYFFIFFFSGVALALGIYADFFR